MKVTPLGEGMVVLGLVVAAFFSVRRFAPDLKLWATGQKGSSSAKGEAVNKGDFDALKGAPPDPERGKGSEGVAPASASVGSGKLDRPLVVAINTWAGHSPGVVFNNGMDPNPGSSYKKKYGLDVKFVLFEDPATKLPALPTGNVHITCDPLA